MTNTTTTTVRLYHLEGDEATLLGTYPTRDAAVADARRLTEMDETAHYQIQAGDDGAVEGITVTRSRDGVDVRC